MKTSWDEVMRYAPSGSYRPEAEACDTEKIRATTMKKLGLPARETRGLPRPARLGLLAAAIAVLLCCTAFAAYTNGWFGFERIFGEKTALVAPAITAYGEGSEAEVTYPTYSEAEQKMIEEGTMWVPQQAKLGESGGVSAETDDYVFTLESMLVSRDALYAVMRIQARNDGAAARLAAMVDIDTYMLELESDKYPYVTAENNSYEKREKELKNGGMSMTVLRVEDGTGYALVTNNGGEFAAGDKILFQTWFDNTNLFEVPVSALLETERTITLDERTWDGLGYTWQSVLITPVSLTLNGRYAQSLECVTPEITVTLTSGVSFRLTCPSAGEDAASELGTYGFRSFSGTYGEEDDPFMKESWLFSQLISLDEVRSITVAGTEYPVN